MRSAGLIASKCGHHLAGPNSGRRMGHEPVGVLAPAMVDVLRTGPATARSGERTITRGGPGPDSPGLAEPPPHG